MRYIIYASQLNYKYKRELEVVKIYYKFMKSIVKLLDSMGWVML
jgi:hypothetical protein